MELEKIVTLPGPNLILLDTFRVKKYNRSTYVLNGNFSLNDRVDDTVDALFVNYNFQGREYRKIFERLIRKVCTSLFVETFRKTYESFVTHSDLPKFGDCDFRPVRKNILERICNLKKYFVFIEGL